MKHSRCSAKQCGAPIIWAETSPNKKSMPIDMGCSAGGAWRLENTDRDVPTCIYVPKDERIGRSDLHETHFATCPESAEFSRKKSRKGATV